MIRLSVVVPAFNEELRIRGALERLTEYLARQEYRCELVVVDDGSTDATAKIVEDWIRGWEDMRLVAVTPNKGKGYAVREGMLAAAGQWRLMCDADLSTPIEEVEKFWPLLDSNDIVIGSRAVPGSRVEVHQPWLRESLGKLFNRVMRPLTGLPFRDTQCGFKIFGARAAEAVFGPLHTCRFAFDVEVLLRAVRLGFTVAEWPIVWRNSPHTKVRPLRDGLRMLLDTVRIRWMLQSESPPRRELGPGSSPTDPAGKRDSAKPADTVNGARS